MHFGSEPRVFVHGFLGLATDWQAWARPNLDVSIDLWSIAAAYELAPLADAFQFAAEKIHAALPKSGKTVLIGYSLGARLAMHALLLRPERFSAAVFVSGHPGLLSEDERAKRTQSDREWAERFRSEPWSELMAAWNDQAVLRSARANLVSRDEPTFTREALAVALERWSLGRQRDLRQQLAVLDVPILLLTGAEDKKFTALNLEWMKNLAPAKIQHRIVPEAGHRVPWEQPQNFVEALQGFC